MKSKYNDRPQVHTSSIYDSWGWEATQMTPILNLGASKISDVPLDRLIGGPDIQQRRNQKSSFLKAVKDLSGNPIFVAHSEEDILQKRTDQNLWTAPEPEFKRGRTTFETSDENLTKTR